MSLLGTWIIRYGHVLSATTWVGGYALLAFIVIPVLSRVAGKPGAGEVVSRIAITAVRVQTYAGVLTIGFGLMLITRTRGYSQLVGTPWGTLVLTAMGIAVALLGIGDGALRPALRRLAGGDLTAGHAARRWALIGFALTALAIGVMTGAVYASG